MEATENQIIYISVIIKSLNCGENQLREAPLLRRYQNQMTDNSQLHNLHFSILICIHNYNTGVLHRFSHLLFHLPLKNNHLFNTCFFVRQVRSKWKHNRGNRSKWKHN